MPKRKRNVVDLTGDNDDGDDDIKRLRILDRSGASMNVLLSMVNSPPKTNSIIEVRNWRSSIMKELTVVISFILHPQAAYGATDISRIVAGYAETNYAHPNDGIDWCRSCMDRYPGMGGLCGGCGSSKQYNLRVAMFNELKVTDEKFWKFRQTWPRLQGDDANIRLRAMYDTCIQFNRYLTGAQLTAALNYAVPTAIKRDQFTQNIIARFILTFQLSLGVRTSNEQDTTNEQGIKFDDGADGCIIYGTGRSESLVPKHYTIEQLYEIVQKGPNNQNHLQKVIRTAKAQFGHYQFNPYW